MICVRNTSRAESVSLLVILFALGALNTASAQSSVPSPWTAVDIGSPAIPGTTSYSQGTFRIDAAGANIYGSSDQFHFVYQAVSGDVEVIARVDTLTQADLWSKAGVMIRGSLAANAEHGFAHLTAGNGARFLRRTTAGGTTYATAGPVVVAPQWVRIVRLGSTITAYSSANGTTWTTIGSATIALGTTAYVGLAVVSCNASLTTSADVSQVTVKPLGVQALPAGQQTMDIGAPAIAGSATYSAGTYTVKGAGADIWGTADQFRYVYQPVTGDVDIKVRVASLTYANVWSKAGVMVRETLTAGSRHAFAVATAGSGYTFQRRIDPNGFSTSTSGGTGAPPGWLRLVRTADQFEAFRSTDGNTWTSMGSDTVPMASAVYVGIAVTSHTTTATATAVLDSLTVTAGTPAPNQPPTVSITSPVSGNTFTVPADVALTASASDSDGTIARVDFYNGATMMVSDPTAPYTATLTSLAAGSYTLTAVAVDAAGASATSSAVTITVSTTVNLPPTVLLTAPANGATYTAPATVTLSATASDPEAKMARVEFYNGATLLNSDTTSPYSFSWTSVAAGTYAIKAIAYDTAGASASSAVATITVNGAANLPPTVALTAPSTGATYTAPATVSLTAAASDPEGNLARVEFYSGSTLLGSDTTSPYSFSWSSVSAGTYTLKAIAYDAAGASATSTTVTITVATTTTPPTKVVFQASADHATLVTSYTLDVFVSGANPNTATPVATSNLGKPTPDVNNDITVDRATLFSALAAGNYIATVSASGSGGSSRSLQAAFTR